MDLIQRAWRMIESFLTAQPEDPAADQAAFAAANALLELKDYKQAAAACESYAARFPKSDLLDSFWYVTGYCRFAMGQPKEALAMCRKVAEAQRVDKKTGRLGEAPNKWRAIYILGQVYQSLGQAADAIREYRRVENRFADARSSIAWFLRKTIQLPEVTTVKPGVPAEMDLKFRNMAACDTKVYRIDLMKFSLLQGDLSGITRINLAGIRPLHDATVPLGDGNDYRDRTHKLSLPLEKEGAYLVVCRGEDRHTSGLVLVTPLEIEVQADRAGQVRTMVKDTITDRYLSGAEVRVTGSRMNGFVFGQTDLRGSFVAAGIQGEPTVIAQAGPGRYAFFRGSTLVEEEPPETEIAGMDRARKKIAADADPFGGDAGIEPTKRATPKKAADADADPFGGDAGVEPTKRATPKQPAGAESADSFASAGTGRPKQQPPASTPARERGRKRQIPAADTAPNVSVPLQAIDMGGGGIEASEKRIKEAAQLADGDGLRRHAADRRDHLLARVPQDQHCPRPQGVGGRRDRYRHSDYACAQRYHPAVCPETPPQGFGAYVRGGG